MGEKCVPSKNTLTSIASRLLVYLCFNFSRSLQTIFPWGILGDMSLFSWSQCSFFSTTSPGSHTLDIQNHFRTNERSQNYPCICMFSSPVLITNFLGPRAWQTGTNPLRPGSRVAPSGTKGRLSPFSPKPHPMYFPCKTESLLGGGPAITQLGPTKPMHRAFHVSEVNISGTRAGVSGKDHSSGKEKTPVRGKKNFSELALTSFGRERNLDS